MAIGGAAAVAAVAEAPRGMVVAASDIAARKVLLRANVRKRTGDFDTEIPISVRA
jgi:hypothetical protein